MNLDPYSPLNKNSQEVVPETGLTLRAIIERLGGQPGFLFGIAAAILSIIALVATAFVPSSPELVWFPFAILLFGLTLVTIETRRAYSEVKSTEEEAPPASPIRYVSPVMVTASDPVSVGFISSQVLMEPMGGISLWIYVDQFYRGIRKMTKYNKYLIAHDTNGGEPKEINDKRRYINSFALYWGPTDWKRVRDPMWKIELSNNRGESKRYYFTDSRSMSAGWHHFLVRWDHNVQRFELLVDGEQVISADSYLNYWPHQYHHMSIGGRKKKGHLIETFVWRVQPLYEYPNEEWLNRELTNIPPSKSKILSNR